MKHPILVAALSIFLISPTLFAAVPVNVEPVTFGSIRDMIGFSGEVKPFVEGFVTSDVSGRVDKILLENGDPVTEGGPIVLLEKERFQIAVQQAEAALQMAEQKEKETQRDFERNKVLADRKVINEKVFDLAETAFASAKSSVKQAKAALDLARLNLERATLKAPIGGFFVNRQVFPGQGISPGVVAGKVIDLRKVFIEVRIPENIIARIKPGQACSVEGGFQGKIAHVDLYADSSRSFLVKILVENPELKLKANMFLKGEIVLSTANEVPLVPIQALVSESGKTFVFSVVQGRGKKNQVTVVAREGSKAQVEGLDPSVPIVVVGQENLSDGTEVVIPKPAGPEQPPPQRTESEKSEPPQTGSGTGKP